MDIREKTTDWKFDFINIVKALNGAIEAIEKPLDLGYLRCKKCEQKLLKEDPKSPFESVSGLGWLAEEVCLKEWDKIKKYIEWKLQNDKNEIETS